MSLTEKPEAVHREETKDKILKLFRECRSKGDTLIDTAYATTALYYDLSEDCRQENVKLGKEILRLQKKNKELKQALAQKGLI
ncbi:MAG: hypothetical protein ABJG33_00230 [Balneola sp.]